MTFVLDRPWDPASPSPSAPAHLGGTASVWLLELSKMTRLLRVRLVLVACLLGPFLVAGAITLESALPQDTLFGQWLHESGYALPMVVLAFAGQWLLPLLAAVVAGDIFSAEDHFGTWKTVLSRSCSRGQVFAGKGLAAGTYTLFVLVVLGTQAVVGLSGQLVPSDHAVMLVAASWSTQLPPLLGFCALSIMLSVVTRNSPAGMGGPVLIGLVMQLMSLVNVPMTLRAFLLSTPFGAWHGLWVQSPYRAPVREGLATSGGWLVVSLVVAWLVFRRRSIGTS
jgi:ABC-2 type transport system permease protein